MIFRNKINKKFKTPIFASMMLPSMLFGLPAVQILINHADKPFLKTWTHMLKVNTPITLGFIFVAGVLYHTIASYITE